MVLLVFFKTLTKLSPSVLNFPHLPIVLYLLGEQLDTTAQPLETRAHPRQIKSNPLTHSAGASV